jgi:iron(III) transport system ATP-binding protein
VLQLENVSKSYGKQIVLADINCSIEQGEIVSILGQSGSGKTTLLHLILGLESVSSGKIIFNEKDITQRPLEKRPFNIVFQDYALFPNLTAYENIVYGLRNKKNVTTRAEVDELIDLLDLRSHLKKSIASLSGGQKQRVALARTLVMKPDVLLLDEPLSALDSVIKESIKQRIKEIAKVKNLTIIIVTHDPEEALTMSDKIMVLEQGEIAQYSTPQEIIAKANCEFVQKFVVEQLAIKQMSIQALFAKQGMNA